MSGKLYHQSRFYTLWVNSSPLALANVTGSFGGKPDISDGKSGAEAIPDLSVGIVGTGESSH